MTAPAAAMPNPAPCTTLLTTATPGPPVAALCRIAKALPVATFPIALWVVAAREAEERLEMLTSGTMSYGNWYLMFT